MKHFLCSLFIYFVHLIQFDKKVKLNDFFSRVVLMRLVLGKTTKQHFFIKLIQADHNLTEHYRTREKTVGRAELISADVLLWTVVYSHAS